MFQKLNLAVSRYSLAEHCFEQFINYPVVLRKNKCFQVHARQTGAINSKHFCCSQVCFKYAAVVPESQISGWRKVIKLSVYLETFFKLKPGPGKLLLLYFKFNLVNIQFMDNFKYFFG